MQKYALNKMDPHLPPDIGRRTRRPSRLWERIYDKHWLIGTLMTYLGEGGNWIALTQVSPTIVTPLGILSVLTNVYLAHFFLNEELSIEQQRGYLWVGLGVFGILFFAPKQGFHVSSYEEFIQVLTSSSFVLGTFGLIFVQSLLLYILLFKGTHRIGIYVTACALFGAVTVSLARIVSILIQLKITMFAVAALIALVLASVLSQEYLKQQAITRFPVSQFNPLLYAGFNTSVVFFTVFLFKEIPTWSGTLLFLGQFGGCLSLVLMGIAATQDNVKSV